jgi:hypothetical protein
MSKLAGSLNFRDFMRRGQVLSQYRSFQRELRLLPAKSASRVELAQKIREGFRQNKNEKDRSAVKAMLTEGTRQLQFLRTYAGTARRGSGIREPSIVNNDINGSDNTTSTTSVSVVLGTDGAGEGTPQNKSWVGTGDKDDIRGRVGVGWPWGS